MDLQIIATLNSHLLSPGFLRELAANGVTMFRLNGGHVLPSQLERYCDSLRGVKAQGVKVLVDLPGSKIRTVMLEQPIVLTAGETFALHRHEVNHPDFLSCLQQGDSIVACDGEHEFRVEAVFSDKAVFRSQTDGLLGNNKGIYLIGKRLSLPLLFERDRELIREAIRLELDFVGLSFVRTAADIEEARSIIGNSSLRLMVKIETQSAVENLDGILGKATDFIIDRGDLGCHIGVEHLAHAQERVVRRAKQRGRQIYVATGLLTSMLYSTRPSISEICLLHDIMRSGVDGIQLSEETAIGKYPIETLKMIQRVWRSAVSNPNHDLLPQALR